MRTLCASMEQHGALRRGRRADGVRSGPRSEPHAGVGARSRGCGARRSAGRAARGLRLARPADRLLARYRKLHLFDVDLPGRVSVRESETRVPGSDLVTVATTLGTLGLSICYDLRFPELYRGLAARGAEILLVPSAFTFPTGAAHWEVLCRARAIENQCYVIAADQTGTSPNGVPDYGDSCIIDPWGRVLARAGDCDGVVTATIDLGYLARVRRDMPCLAHARLTT